ncbi:tetratricopeptide repeat protein [Emcibacter sp.]|uniref:tetratricopeptide repeat protein n=1 Tax=Emcibacter sp. TaxID=1979954 RepID=UPI003A8E6D06
MPRNKTANDKPVAPPQTKGQFGKYIKKGNLLYKNGEYSQALQIMNAAWQFDPENTEIAVIVADCLFHLGIKNKALELLTHILEKSPGNPDICSVLGQAAMKMNFFELSYKCYELYTRLKPDNYRGYVNLTSALREMGRLDDAIGLLQEILPLFPETADLWNSLAAAVQARDGLEASLVFYEEALRLDPNNRQVLNNLPDIYYGMGRIEDAKKTLEHCLEVSSEYASPHLRYSQILLCEGNFEEGWKHYEWRKHKSNTNHLPAIYSIPEWRPGQSLKGKTLLISAEQGVGDELLATPLFERIISEAKKVHIGCDRRLVDLLQHSFPSATIHACYFQTNPTTGNDLRVYPDLDVKEVDLMCYSLDTLRNQWRHLNDIEAKSKILFPPEELVQKWQERIAALPGRLKVGICWRSGVLHVQRKRHYAELEEWLPILQNKKVDFINIQYGECSEELKSISEKFDIEIHNFQDLDLKDDFEGTAAMMSCLDLAMGPTTTPVLQAGTTGVETWWLTDNMPWWTFGEEKPRWLEKGYIHAKKPTEKWSEFMKEMGKTFDEWVEKKLS